MLVKLLSSKIIIEINSFECLFLICLEQVLGRYPLTHFCAPPTAIRYMVKEKLTYADNSHLRRCIGAGESVVNKLAFF